MHRSEQAWRAVGAAFFRSLILALVVVASFSARATAQPGDDESRIIVTDLGTIGLTGGQGSLSSLLPSLVHRPIDMLTVRPGGDAWGMGGAYIAHATGPVAVAWNPAGLGFLDRPEAYADGLALSSSGRVGDHPDTFLIPESPPVVIPSYGVTQKGGLLPNLVSFGLPLHRFGPLDLVGAASWRRFAGVALPEETVMEMVTAQTGGFPIVLSLDRNEHGSVEAFTGTLAARLGSSLSLGANFNVLDGGLRSTSDVRLTSVGAPLRAGGSFRYRYSGTATEFGARYLLGDWLELGARFMPEFTLEVRDGRLYSEGLTGPGQPQIIVLAEIADHDLAIPSSFGAGLTVRPARHLLLAADYNDQAWSDTRLKYTDGVAYKGGDLPLTDQSSWHLGAEYTLIRASWGELPIRAGFRTAPLGFAGNSRGDVTVDTLVVGAEQTTIVNHTGQFFGEEVESHAISFGASLVTPAVAFHLGYETLSYDVEKWFLDVPYSQLENPDLRTVKVERTLNTIRLSASYRF